MSKRNCWIACFLLLIFKYGLVFSEQEWSEEWKSLLRLSSAEPRTLQTKSSDCNPSNDEYVFSSWKWMTIFVLFSLDLSKSTENNNGSAIKPLSQSPRQYYESLEEFHVYVLANNIRRPIVIYSDTILRTNDGEAISPIEFGGIYLPLGKLSLWNFLHDSLFCSSI